MANPKDMGIVKKVASSSAIIDQSEVFGILITQTILIFLYIIIYIYLCYNNMYTNKLLSIF